MLHGSGHVNTVAAKPSADMAVGTKILSQQSEDMTVETTILSQPGKDTTVKTKMFSEKWAAEYSGDDLGCEMGRGSYTWRPCGFGSNINSEKFNSNASFGRAYINCASKCPGALFSIFTKNENNQEAYYYSRTR